MNIDRKQLKIKVMRVLDKRQLTLINQDEMAELVIDCLLLVWAEEMEKTRTCDGAGAFNCSIWHTLQDGCSGCHKYLFKDLCL